MRHMKRLLFMTVISSLFFSAYAANIDCRQYKNTYEANACQSLATQSIQAQQNFTNDINSNMQKYQQATTQAPNTQVMPQQVAPQQPMQARPQTPSAVPQKQQPAKQRPRIHY
jgi:hypothetical protein